MHNLPAFIIIIFSKIMVKMIFFHLIFDSIFWFMEWKKEKSKPPSVKKNLNQKDNKKQQEFWTLKFCSGKLCILVHIWFQKTCNTKKKKKFTRLTVVSFHICMN